MLGLPTETDEDIIGIADTANRIVDLFYSIKNRPMGKQVSISVSASTFVPKPFTPFWSTATKEEIEQKQLLLVRALKSKENKS